MRDRKLYRLIHSIIIHWRLNLDLLYEPEPMTNIKFGFSKFYDYFDDIL